MFSSNNSQVANDVKYIEEYFSTFLYSGTSSSQTITNGIDLSTKGGLIWTKCRSAAYDHQLIDTARGGNQILYSNLTNGSSTTTPAIVSFGTTGYTINSGAINALNNSGSTFASWSIAKTPKFFDVVTYTGTGSAQNIAHSLGSTPGCIIVKRTDSTSTWPVYHVSVGASKYLTLNTTNTETISSIYWNNTAPTSTQFTVGSSSVSNASGGTYVAYLFAHNAGGFGLTGTDNVISCGSYNSATAINLGYEPQWLMVKRSSDTGSWYIINNMTGFTSSAFGPRLFPNLNNAEGDDSVASVTSTGFNSQLVDGAGTYIYIAIRRGPMKVPTDATKVFSPVTYTGNGSSQSLTAGFPISLGMFKYRGGATNSFEWFDRLRGAGADLRSAYTYAELATTTEVTSFASNTQVTVGASSDTGGTNASGQTYVLEAFQRAPSFFDEVCYTGTGSATTVTHNLGVTPELMIVKSRSGTGNWKVWNKSSLYTNLWLNSDVATQSDSVNSPTATTFAVFNDSNTSSVTYVAYLFATAAGVSKVGSYTGTGTTLQINCGFTAGSRFVLIKRTDDVGSWYVWDVARGIVSGNDPYLLLNSTAAEVTSTDYIDTYSAGFEISSTAPAAINASGGTFIFLAIA